MQALCRQLQVRHDLGSETQQKHQAGLWQLPGRLFLDGDLQQALQ